MRVYKIHVYILTSLVPVRKCICYSLVVRLRIFVSRVVKLVYFVLFAFFCLHPSLSSIPLLHLFSFSASPCPSLSALVLPFLKSPFLPSPLAPSLLLSDSFPERVAVEYGMLPVLQRLGNLNRLKLTPVTFKNSTRLPRTGMSREVGCRN